MARARGSLDIRRQTGFLSYAYREAIQTRADRTALAVFHEGRSVSVKGGVRSAGFAVQ